MTDRPIIFSAPMVRALLDGRKTQTRRKVKFAEHLRHEATGELVNYYGDHRLGMSFKGTTLVQPFPYYPGQRLWVRHAADCFPVYFRRIPFGDGKYAVGTDGHVYARDGDEWTKRVPRLSHNGYEEISLRFNGDQRSFRINRLVAEAFYGLAPEGHVCRHMDGDRRNNVPENLDWGTHAQNSADAAAAGSFSGERASKARLSSDDVEQIRLSSEPQSALADRYGVTQPTISKIKNGKRWSEPSEAPSRNLPAFQLWRSPIFCPRWASRLTLTATEVRVQQLQEISEADARAEGAAWHDGGITGHSGWRHDQSDVHADARSAFARLWNSIHGPDAWDANPWVCAVTFTVKKRNIDN